MLFDAVLQTLLMKAFQRPPIKDAVERFTQMVYDRALFPLAWGALDRIGYGTIEKLLMQQFDGQGASRFARILQPLGGTLVGWAVGSPLGFSLPYNLVGDADSTGNLTNAKAPWTDQGSDAIRDYVDSDSVPTHDTPPANPDLGAEGSSGLDAPASGGSSGSQSDAGLPMDQNVPADAGSDQPGMSVDPASEPNGSSSSQSDAALPMDQSLPADAGSDQPGMSVDPASEPNVSMPGDTSEGSAVGDPPTAADAPNMSVDPSQSQTQSPEDAAVDKAPIADHVPSAKGDPDGGAGGAD